jgi:hypothetical protein
MNIKNKLVAVAALAASSLCPACAVHEVRVSAFTPVVSPQTPLRGAKVAVYRDPSADDTRLESRIALKIESLLAEHGCVVWDLLHADYVLFFDYVAHLTGIGNWDPPDTSHYLAPRPPPGGGAQMPQFPASWPSTTPPHTGRLAVRVADAKAPWLAGMAVLVWDAAAISSSRSSNLRDSLDYLLVATFEHVGQDTGKPVDHSISSSDQRVRSLRGF